MTPQKLMDTLRGFAATQGFELNAEEAHVLALMEGLLRNEARYGYRLCPCRLARNDRELDRDIICPCVYRPPDVAEFGSCYCGLYVSPAWNRGEIGHAYVPERRPLEKRSPKAP